MSESDDEAYYLQREEQERSAAAEAADANIAAIHAKLAEAYAEMGRKAGQSCTYGK